MENIVAALEGAGKTYPGADVPVVALQPTTLAFERGRLALILGPSGSGKTTLLSLLGCVIYPTTGKVSVGGEYVDNLSEKRLAKIRLKQIGFVFQSFNLIAPITALENVLFPMRLQGVSMREARRRAEDMLHRVGLYEKRFSLPKQLSGGQQQRVSIARALVTQAPLILCDEPTASLDKESSERVMKELKSITAENRAVAIVTHDTRLIPYADRVIYVTNGVASETPPDEFDLH